jgi:hypothetical protein
MCDTSSAGTPKTDANRLLSCSVLSTKTFCSVYTSSAESSVHKSIFTYFVGTPDDTAAELQRLTKLSSNLAAGDTAAAASAAAGGGKADPLLALLLQWRQQRQAAVTAEIARLSAVAVEDGASSRTMLRWLLHPVSKFLAAW